MSALAARDPLLPRSPDGTAPGALLSLLAHGALVAALAYGVGWRSPAPVTVSAELWAAVPQAAAPAGEPPPAAPPAPGPPPAPAATTAPPPTPAATAPAPEAQIAIEKARREKVERERAEQEGRERRDRLERERRAQAERAEDAKRQREAQEREKAEREKLARAQAAEQQRLAKERAAADAREAAAEEARLAKQREDNLRRMMGQLGGAGEPTSRGTAAVEAAPSAAYAGRLVKAIKGNLIFDWRGPGNPPAVVEVRAAPSGTIIGRTLVKGSGVKEWDDAILRAIDRTARLPADADGRVPATLTITFRPLD